jgi:hypothetical protein
LTAKTTSNGHKLVSLDELTARPLPYEDVPVPEYGDDITIRLNAVTGDERKRLVELSNADETTVDRIEFVHEMIAASIGGSASPETVSKLPSQVIDSLKDVAMRLTGFDANAVNDKAEDLKGTPSGESG